MKRLLVVFLSLVIMVSFMSVNAWADDLDGEDDSIYENRLRYTYVQSVDVGFGINSSHKASWDADILAPALSGGVFDLIATLQKYNSSTGKYAKYDYWIKTTDPVPSGYAYWYGSKTGIPKGKYRMKCVFGVGKGPLYENVVRYSSVVNH